MTKIGSICHVLTTVLKTRIGRITGGDDVHDAAGRGRSLLICFIQTVEQFENLVGRCTQVANDVPIRGIVLAFELASCLVDEAKTARDLLSLCVRDEECPRRRPGRLVFHVAATRLSIAMTLAPGVSHVTSGRTLDRWSSTLAGPSATIPAACPDYSTRFRKRKGVESDGFVTVEARHRAPDPPSRFRPSNRASSRAPRSCTSA